jgi:hypothetical protein
MMNLPISITKVVENRGLLTSRRVSLRLPHPGPHPYKHHPLKGHHLQGVPFTNSSGLSAMPRVQSGEMDKKH